MITSPITRKSTKVNLKQVQIQSQDQKLLKDYKRHEAKVSEKLSILSRVLQDHEVRQAEKLKIDRMTDEDYVNPTFKIQGKTVQSNDPVVKMLATYTRAKETRDA
jgi:hypothetical protein